MNTAYRTTILKQFRDQQVRFAPREKKLAQADRAERLIYELDPQQQYTYGYICQRLTDFSPQLGADVVISGQDALHDLRLLVEDLTDAADLRVEELAEPVVTLEELARQYNVSTKTIARWRAAGLVSRRVVMEGRKRVGFLHSSVQQFVNRNPDRVRRGERFSQLTDEERAEIIERARQLAQTGALPTEITRRLASQMGRSVETIRYTLKQFDEAHPEARVFEVGTGPLGEETKRRIYEQYLRGTSVQALAARYHRTPSSIFRIVNEMRARRIMELPLEYIYNEQFDRPDADELILTPMPGGEVAQRRVRVPPGLPPYLAALYEHPLLTREQEYHLFRKYNYLKYKAAKLRERLDPQRPQVRLMDKIEELYEEAVRVKNQIVQANLRLVVSIAKRHVTPTDDFFSLVSDGNMSLIRAVEKFDFSRGNKFSTYASWAIMKNYARTIPEEFRYRDRFRSGQDEFFLGQKDERTDQYEQEAEQRLREQQIRRILSCLDEREQKIIVSRFGLDHSQQPLTLKQVGEEMGVTKERVRQIEARALRKLREAAAAAHIEPID
ncbi:MAG: DNA-directed RNA polymerase sigma-70 factor [Pirellulaceae bacterium]|nr:MAG: DNA-directed RNA polymerase sigma-70 factor [Pirellulaceae bacterium]